MNEDESNNYSGVVAKFPYIKKSSSYKFYLGWRGNPQLSNGGYYVAFGQLSKADVKKKEDAAYG